MNRENVRNKIVENVKCKFWDSHTDLARLMYQCVYDYDLILHRSSLDRMQQIRWAAQRYYDGTLYRQLVN